jgi:hypothetical protein
MIGDMCDHMQQEDREADREQGHIALWSCCQKQSEQDESKEDRHANRKLQSTESSPG